MSKARISVAAFIAPLFLWACPEPGLPPEEAAQARRTIHAWLECEECEQGELEAVVQLGEIVVPSLIATLRGGPSSASREKLRRQLVDTYRELTEYARTHPEAQFDMSEDDYVTHYMGNYEALYQVRSARALAAIGGAEARRALEEMRDADVRPDVQAAVSDALEQMGG